MALITAGVQLPDLNYEFHTITIDSVGQSSANTFTVYLQQPLKNVVQAKLVAAKINSNVSDQHCFVSISELNSNFNDRAFKDLSDANEASKAQVRGAFASLVSEAYTSPAGLPDHVFLFKDNYPVVTQYITPIRTIDRLTVTLLDQNGTSIQNPQAAADNFLIIRFTCLKQNI
jgi:hypothetical protein